MPLYLLASYKIFSSVKFGDLHVHVFFYNIITPTSTTKGGSSINVFLVPNVYGTRVHVLDRYNIYFKNDNISCSSYKQFTRDWS